MHLSIRNNPLLVLIIYFGLCLCPLPISRAAILSLPIADYPFQGNAMDQSTNNLHGTVTGPTLINDRFNKPEATAYHFDNTDDFIEIPNTDDKLTLLHSWSVVAWVRPHADGIHYQRDPIVWKVDEAGKNGDNYYIAWGAGNAFQAGFEGNNGGEFNVLSNPDIAIDVWHQVAAVYDEADLVIYVNGHEHGRNSIRTIIPPFHGDAPLRIGSNLHTSHGNRGTFNGDIDDVKIFDRALTQSEVIVLWRGEKLPEPATATLLLTFTMYPITRRQR